MLDSEVLTETKRATKGTGKDQEESFESRARSSLARSMQRAVSTARG